MANNDLVLQKMLRVTPETHARVMQVIAEIQTRTKVNTSADSAVVAMLDAWDVMKEQNKDYYPLSDTSVYLCDSGFQFLDKYFV